MRANGAMNARNSPQKLIILLVEDEVLVRMALADDLRGQGYGIIEAANADEALSILESNAEIDLVITDKRMPGFLDGMGLARSIRSRGDVGVIMISGEAPEAEATEFLDAYLRKPYRASEVLLHVRAIARKLDDHRG
jgi:DNA-binding response OmpR family regulator